MEVALAGVRFVRDGRPILQIPSLRFMPNATTAIFGPNGSGKTTLLRLVTGLDRPTEGTVQIGGTAVGKGLGLARRPALAFQSAVFVAGTVRYNLELALELRGIARSEHAARIAEAASECGIGHLLERSARQLSGGEAQRVNLARALALRAPVTLLDEPLSGIDRLSRLELLDDLPRLLATFAATTLLVTHDREEAFRLADHIVVLLDGRVRMAGPKRDVYEHPADRASAELLGYTVVPGHSGLMAVPPNGFRLGEGSLTFPCVVSHVVDMGHHRHLVGHVGENRVDVRLAPAAAAPDPGTMLKICAETFVPVADHLP